jgi:hypothetical protein
VEACLQARNGLTEFYFEVEVKVSKRIVWNLSPYF